MTTAISLSSNALLLIGHSTINSFSDAGAGARSASNLYPATYEEALTSYPWRFAIGKVTLARLNANPLNEWAYAHQLPKKCLLVYRTYPRSRYEIFEDKIYSNSSKLEVDFWFKPQESGLPPYFVKYLQYALAAELAIPVTDNRALAELYEAKAGKQLLVAMNRDSQSRTNYAIESAPLLECR